MDERRGLWVKIHGNKRQKVDRMIEYGGHSHDELLKKLGATQREARNLPA